MSIDIGSYSLKELFEGYITSLDLFEQGLRKSVQNLAFIHHRAPNLFVHMSMKPGAYVPGFTEALEYLKKRTPEPDFKRIVHSDPELLAVFEHMASFEAAKSSLRQFIIDGSKEIAKRMMRTEINDSTLVDPLLDVERAVANDDIGEPLYALIGSARKCARRCQILSEARSGLAPAPESPNFSVSAIGEIKQAFDQLTAAQQKRNEAGELTAINFKRMFGYAHSGNVLSPTEEDQDFRNKKRYFDATQECAAKEEELTIAVNDSIAHIESIIPGGSTDLLRYVQTWLPDDRDKAGTMILRLVALERATKQAIVPIPLFGTDKEPFRHQEVVVDDQIETDNGDGNSEPLKVAATLLVADKDVLPIDGLWLMPPVSLAELAARLDNITTEKAKIVLKPHGLRNYPSGNRQNWTVNMKGMDQAARDKIQGKKTRPN